MEEQLHNQTDSQGRKQGYWETPFEHDRYIKADLGEHSRRSGFWEHYVEGIGKGQYVDGMRQGKWKYYYSKNGLLESEGHYKDDLRHGFWKYYNYSGSPIIEGHYLNDHKEGLWKKSYWRDEEDIYYEPSFYFYRGGELDEKTTERIYFLVYYLEYAGLI
jgi:hypothetical protein